MDLKVTKKKVFLTANLIGGEKISGYIFLSTQSAFRYGEELVLDLLNDQASFFPFETEATSVTRIINKNNIVFISTNEDLKIEEDLGRKKQITVILISGQTVTRSVTIDQPEYRARVLDVLTLRIRGFYGFLLTWR